MKEITEDEMQSYVAGFRARQAFQEARRRVLEDRAKEAVARWLELLQAIPEIKRVILYGSLAKGTFHEGSDIDIVVEGLPVGAHFRVWAELEGQEDFDLDLQRWEELSPGFRQLIESYGQVLFARS